MTDLSVLIPARNEIFLYNTVQDILTHAEGNTEIIAVLDGEWADPPLPFDPRLSVVYFPASIGQRAATNVAARMARGKYVMKCDAHCAFEQGFDVKLMADMQDDWTVVPIMRNLHAFNWVCEKCGDARYQGPRPTSCPNCDNTADFKMDVVWIAKPSPQSASYCFDPEPHFQYFRDFNKRPAGKGDLTETMSLQGSCWMLTRDKYFELDVCDEQFGSWGSQGIEISAKTWLSGGKVMVNHKTWYAHMFRTQGNGFSFPYPISGRQVDHAKKLAKQLFFENQWAKQVRPLSWLVDRFWPVPGWTEADLQALKEKDKPPHLESVQTGCAAGILYYTDNRLDPRIMERSQKQLLGSVNGNPIVSVSLEPLDFGKNIVLPLERGYLTMFKQILAGLEALNTDYVFFCEHDVIYHPSHFEFVPPRDDVFYYNENTWKVRHSDGHALFYRCKQTSGLCASRQLLLEHYKKRVENTQRAFETLDRLEYGRFIRRQGFEPGTHHRTQRVDDITSEGWMSPVPNIDIRHDKNLTPSRWSQDQFRDQRNCREWQESDVIPGWGRYQDLMEVTNG